MMTRTPKTPLSTRDRLAYDLAGLLIGPTCRAEAERLVALLLASANDEDVVAYLEDVVARYRGDLT